LLDKGIRKAFKLDSAPGPAVASKVQVPLR
jgi:hypothetical protein